MNIITLSLGQLQTNCYLVICPQTQETIIIDPADDANFVSEKIIRERLNPIAIIATHGHFDHILSAQELQLAFDIPFFIHPKDQEILQKMNQSASWWLKRKIIEKPPKINKLLKENETIKFGPEKLRIIETPGHTPGSICLYSQKEKILFSGDTIFKNGTGRTDFSYSSPQLMKESLKKIKRKFAGFHVYPGHGESFILTS